MDVAHILQVEAGLGRPLHRGGVHAWHDDIHREASPSYGGCRERGG